MTSTISNYFAALNEMDREAYLACFNLKAILLDPYGRRPLHGTNGLNIFMDDFERTWAHFQIKPGEQYASGDRVAVSWTAKGTTRPGKTADFSGINVFTLNDDGLITQLEGYWDFQAMVAQIS